MVIGFVEPGDDVALSHVRSFADAEIGESSGNLGGYGGFGACHHVAVRGDARAADRDASIRRGARGDDLHGGYVAGADDEEAHGDDDHRDGEENEIPTQRTSLGRRGRVAIDTKSGEVGGRGHGGRNGPGPRRRRPSLRTWTPRGCGRAPGSWGGDPGASAAGAHA